MKKKKLISILGLSVIALGLSACSNNKSANQSVSTSQVSSQDSKIEQTKKDAEVVIKALQSDKVNFKSYLHIPKENLDASEWPLKALPASKPTVSISEFAKKHNFNKAQKDLLGELLGGGDSNKPMLSIDPSLLNYKDANKKAIPPNTFNQYKNIKSAYYTISNLKLGTNKNDSNEIKSYEVRADRTVHAVSKDGYKVDYTHFNSADSL